MLMVEDKEMFNTLHRALFTMHDKHERVTGLHDIHEGLSDDMFWALFRQVWEGVESFFLHGHELRQMMTPERIGSANRFTAMESHELDFIKRSARRGKPLKLYRGGSALNHTGFSWTTRRQAAEQHAYLSGSSKPTVTVGRLAVPNVLMYLSGPESEIIALPEHVEVEKIDEHPAQPKMMRQQRQLQIVVQSKGANAVRQQTPAQYFVDAIERGEMDNKVLLDHMTASKKYLEPLGFKTRVATVADIITALEKK